MDEEETKTQTEEEEKNETDADSKGGYKSKKESLVEQANAAAERIELANKQMTENLAKQEELAAKMRLGGQSLGKQEEEKKEETPEEYARRIESGNVQNK